MSGIQLPFELKVRWHKHDNCMPFGGSVGLNLPGVFVDLSQATAVRLRFAENS